MRSLLAVSAMLMLWVNAFAQPPLNKRDQQKKAEFEAQIKAEEDYEKTLERADDAFKGKSYVEARMAYEEAIKYNPDQEQWLTSKVNDLDILMARNAAREVDSIIVLVPKKEMATLPDEGRELSVAQRDSPTKSAPEIVRAEEEEAEEEIASPTQTVSSRDIQLQPKVVTPQPAPKEEVKEEKVEIKVKEDFSAFDNGITEETFTMPDHTVERIVVKEGIDVKVFKRVKHRWGGEYFFLDDMDVSRRYWEEQVRLYREKYPKGEN